MSARLLPALITVACANLAVVAHAETIAGSGSMNGSEPTMSPRFNMGGAPGSACSRFSAGLYQYRFVDFVSDASGSLTASYHPGTCGGDVYVTFHRETFDGGALCTNHLWGPGLAGAFSNEVFAVPPSTRIRMVFSAVNIAPGVTCGPYTYSVSGVVARAFEAVGGTVKFSTEAVGPATPITLPDLRYFMGVSRATTGQDFALIYKLPAGATFATAPAAPIYAGASTPSITLKRGGVGANEVVFSVSPTVEPVNAGETFTFTPGPINNHGLVGNGASLPVQLTILDQNETACVDNSGTPSTCFKTVTAATLVQSSNFLTAGGDDGVTADPGSTTTDVNAPVPLAGFVVDGTAPADTATVAAAALILKNTTAGVRNPTNTADYVLQAGDQATVTITDPTGFLGLAAAGLYLDLDNDGTADTAGTGANGNEIFSLTGNTATLLIDGNHLTGVTGPRSVYYRSDGSTPMGASRVLAAAGAVNPAVTGVADLPYTGNANWWTWASNGTVLETPFFTTFAGQNSRFVFTNTGVAAASYTADCLVEAGNTRTLGPAASGSLAAGQQTVVLASNLCSFSGNPRAAARFTINAPNSVVKGVYNVVNQTTGDQTSVEMLRPGSPRR